MPKDPFPYDGPIVRADGTKSFNSYLWPTEWWWANREIHRNIDSRWNFHIVALLDGRFSIEGCVHFIERNEYAGKKIVFATREEAIRISAARMIRVARKSGSWGYQYGGLQGEKLAQVVNWAREVARRESGRAVAKPVTFKEPPPPYRPTGLPLFDFMHQ